MKPEIQDIKAAVVGAGMIGLGMCVLLTGNGIPTFLYARSRQEERRRQYEEILDSMVTDGFLSVEEKERCKTYLTVTGSYDELGEVTVAFECVAEKPDIKKEVFQMLWEHCPKLMAAASTTSAISSEELAQGSPMPEKIMVAHPFYPAYLIPCVEVVPNAGTSLQAFEIMTALLEFMNRKVVVLKKDAPGFIANRLQYAMLREAIHIVEEGIADPEQVDRALMYSFAPRYTSIGIFEHFDNCGLDLAGNICANLYPELADDKTIQSFIRSRLDAGCIGIKSGKGTYAWDENRTAEFRERVKVPYKDCFSWNIPEKPYEAKEERE